MPEDPLRYNLPPTPVEISIFVEGGRYVFKVGDSRPIYSFDKDGRGKSNCDATCIMTWQPVTAPLQAKTVGDWSVIERADKSKQWAYRGKPIYTYVHDQPGQINGDGAEGLWHVVNP